MNWTRTGRPAACDSTAAAITEQAVADDWLGAWAMNQVLTNISTGKFRRATPLPQGDVPASAGASLSKSAASRQLVALSAERLKGWMASDLSGVDVLVVQIDGIHIDEPLVLVAVIAIDGKARSIRSRLIEGATENAARVQALIDNVIERGRDPTVPRLFVIDGAKALTKAIRRSFGSHTPIQGCQIHKARNITGRLSKALHATLRRRAFSKASMSHCVPTWAAE